MQRSFRDSPGPDSAGDLAEAYFDRALATGDPRYVGYAEAVVLAVPRASSARLLSIEGMIRQYRHDFAAAVAAFDAALALDPEFASAHAWKAAVYLVRAEYPLAAGECRALAELGRAILAAGCEGLLQAYTGQLASAEKTLSEALDRSPGAAQRQWLLTRIGEVAAWRGDDRQAERAFRDALAVAGDDAYLLAAWADFLLDAGRPADVLRELAGRESSDPLLLRLAEAAKQTGDPRLSAFLRALGDRFAAAALRGDTTHRAEESRFHLRLLGDPENALRLALENYQEQREPRDARILMEAAAAAGKPDQARAARDWMRRSGFDARRWRELAERGATR